MTHHTFGAKIAKSAIIDCEDLTLGAGTVVGANAEIHGTRVVIGREGWLDDGARIGGGSCHDPVAFLQAGDFLHCGKGSEINIARGVVLGDEVGVGMDSKIFSHGAWLSELEGFPCAFAQVKIGSRVWLPHAMVLPGVEIGSDVVVAAGSVVNKSLPSGCLASGNPCRVVAPNAYPRPLGPLERREVLQRIADECAMRGVEVGLDDCGGLFIASGARFDCLGRSITGTPSEAARLVRDQLRRHGIRFRYSVIDGEYVPWA